MARGKRLECERIAKLKYQSKLRKLQVTLYPKDSDIAKWIDQKETYSAYIRELIREDIARHERTNEKTGSEKTENV